MGDRYEITLDCAYCGTRNEEVWYAPTCGSDIFTCKECNKVNFILFANPFSAKKLEEVTVEDVVRGFILTTTGSWSEDKIIQMCTEHLNKIKGE